MLLAISLTVVMNSVRASQEGPVWFWFATCGGPAMALEVRLDRGIIFKSSFPLCRADRSSIYARGNSKGLHFAFKPHRAIVWQGYRDKDDTTRANQVIEGDIWLAGSDPDALLLGVDFTSSDTIYMNTIHIAHPTQRDRTEIARGLVVTTYPIKRGKEKSP
jgi:hypothetical protein